LSKSHFRVAAPKGVGLTILQSGGGIGRAMDGKSIARLFEAPLDEFVAARDALARELRKAGDGEGAARVTALRKPTKALWLVNQLARRAPGALRKLVEATGRIRAAQEKGGSGDELRAAMREQREALNALVAAAGDPALERRIHDTLQTAALAESEPLLEGRLDRELAPPGFEALSGLPAAPAAPARREKAPPEQSELPAAERKKATRALHEAEKEAARLSAQAKSLEHDAASAQTSADEARTALTKAQQIAEKAQIAAEAARRNAEAARGRAQIAEARTRELRKR
jgi:hypothetical protein